MRAGVSSETAPVAPRLLVHAGRHLTGASALAEWVAEPLGALREAGLHVSDVAQKTLPPDLLEEPMRDRTILWSDLAAETSDAGTHTFLLASDQLQSLRRPEALRSALSAFSRVDVVLGVLSPADYFTTLYQHQVAATGLASLPAPRLEAFRFRTTHALSRWSDALGDSFRPYFAPPPGDRETPAQVPALLRALGLAQDRFPTGDTPVIAGNLLLFKLAFNHFAARPRTQETRLALLTHLRDMADRTARFRGQMALTRELAAALHARFDAETEAVIRNYRLTPHAADATLTAQAMQAAHWPDDAKANHVDLSARGVALPPSEKIAAQGQALLESGAFAVT